MSVKLLVLIVCMYVPTMPEFLLGIFTDLLSDCMLHIALSRDSSPQEKQNRENRPCVRSISWSPIGFASNSGYDE